MCACVCVCVCLESESIKEKNTVVFVCESECVRMRERVERQYEKNASFLNKSEGWKKTKRIKRKALKDSEQPKEVIDSFFS